MDDDVTAFRLTWGQRIRAHRTSRGWSIRDLAARAGMNYAHLGDIELGKAGAGDAVKIQIADALGVAPDLLFSHEGVERPSRCREAAPV